MRRLSLKLRKSAGNFLSYRPAKSEIPKLWTVHPSQQFAFDVTFDLDTLNYRLFSKRLIEAFYLTCVSILSNHWFVPEIDKMGSVLRKLRIGMCSLKWQHFRETIKKDLFYSTDIENSSFIDTQLDCYNYQCISGDYSLHHGSNKLRREKMDSKWK